MHYVLLLIENAWEIWLEAAPWLLVGLVAAGILKTWVPPAFLQRWLGGRGLYPVLKAAVIGTPLPLCSCSVLPTAIQLRRSGASKASTVSFLVATPENGADSIALTYVMLGPVMTIIRPVAAIISAVFTGLLTGLVSDHEDQQAASAESSDNGDCCGTDCCSQVEEAGQPRSRLAEFWHAVIDLLDDIAGWLLIGILLAAALNTFVPAIVPARKVEDAQDTVAPMLKDKPFIIRTHDFVELGSDHVELADVLWTMIANPFAEKTVRVQTERGHHVITTGPYAIVRHPMYLGVILMFVAVPLVLGSAWTFTPVVAMTLVLMARTVLEERLLRRDLPGYEVYIGQTRWRILPGIW